VAAWPYGGAMATTGGETGGATGGATGGDTGGNEDVVVPDTKDWTWTLERPCPECGFDAQQVAPEEVAGLAVTLTAPWVAVLARPDVTERPAPGTWSPLEYGCHVRDVCTVFDERVRLMLAEDDPAFANWDQDRAAVDKRYAEQVPAHVASQLQAAATQVGSTFGAVAQDQWSRTGVRSNGSRFTVLTLGRYFLHDLAHHLVDVGAQG
jgi:DinB superfamily